MSHSILSVQPHEATEPGALAGWWATCSCGEVYSHSLGERWARQLGVEHAEYMNAREAGR